jgi:cobalt-precorrin-5B (C1)-methyltransferase
VAEAANIRHIVGATGKLSEGSIQRFYKLDDKSLLEMGDFAGALIKYLRKKNFAKFTIAGGFAKIAKLSQGNMDLHSGRSQLDMISLASNLENNGAPTSLVKAAYDAKSAGSLLACSGKYPLAEVIASQALEVVYSKLQRLDIDVDIVIFDRSGKLIGHAT